MNLTVQILAGALLCNCIPHLAAGLQGHPFPTPFATPRGVGDSGPLLNVLWGFANLVVGLYALDRHPPARILGPDTAAVLCGALALALYAGWHFGKVMRDRNSR